MRQLRMMTGPGIARSQDLVGTSPTVVVLETPGVTHTTCKSGSSAAGCISIQITVTPSDMSGRLLLLSSHSMAGALLMVRG
jgi:hypothetical protein